VQPLELEPARHEERRFVRRNKLSMTVWDSYELIVAACRDAGHFLIGDPNRIRPISHRNWASVDL
jgi:hypothetical protein